jgi:hypothetical protein
VAPDCTVCAKARPEPASESARAAPRILFVMCWLPLKLIAARSGVRPTLPKQWCGLCD